MRSDPADYELVSPGTLSAVLALMAETPGEWLPIAGGTDLMVLYAAGKLPNRKLVSLWDLPELRKIEVAHDEIKIGAASTYTDLREHQIVRQEFPLLATAARCTGGIANQNRGTLGGNIVNASPAADSLPPLLVYDASLILSSSRGDRRIPYLDFHTGYKKTRLAQDELVRFVCLPRRFGQYTSYSRKVGARKAQAISKVCMAALGRITSGLVDDVRIAVGSVAPVPLRLLETEQSVRGKALDSVLLQRARAIAISEIHPIDDIRSTAAYRAAVVGNLVVEFLEQLARSEQPAKDALDRWNQLPGEPAAEEILPCCGSAAWAHALAERRPFRDISALVAVSDEIWARLTTNDWLEAFSTHPRIGEQTVPRAATGRSASWSAEEQKDVATASDSIQRALAAANREYERRFGRVFIVCATGKSASEMLEILRLRLRNDDTTEMRQTAEEQRKITNLRLQKWLRK